MEANLSTGREEPPRCWWKESGEDFCERCFPRSIFPKEAEDLARPDREVHAGQSYCSIRVDLGQAFRSQKKFGQDLIKKGLEPKAPGPSSLAG